FNWSTPFMKRKVSAQLIERWKRIYDVGMRKAADYSCQIIREILGNSGDETIVVVTSDHGQAFGEHGFIGHGTVLYDEVVKVPMLIILPKGMSKKLGKGEVSLVNVRKFILSAIAGKPDPLLELYSQKVYAESFGIPSNVRQAKGIDMKKLEGYERYTKRTFGK
ncbi:MAG: sulfatase-like hydrolase/transferase, partial [Candidatus Micrarchaeota archaeon]|nr:sulfatase-like hydrolase/transferase [Candidatus Micrarchaeota archaeon]